MLTQICYITTCTSHRQEHSLCSLFWFLLSICLVVMYHCVPSICMPCLNSLPSFFTRLSENPSQILRNSIRSQQQHVPLNVHLIQIDITVDWGAKIRAQPGIEPRTSIFRDGSSPGQVNFLLCPLSHKLLACHFNPNHTIMPCHT